VGAIEPRHAAYPPMCRSSDELAGRVHCQPPLGHARRPRRRADGRPPSAMRGPRRAASRRRRRYKIADIRAMNKALTTYSESTQGRKALKERTCLCRLQLQLQTTIHRHRRWLVDGSPAPTLAEPEPSDRWRSENRS
jgi:hypothetical protein